MDRPEHMACLFVRKKNSTSPYEILVSSSCDPMGLWPIPLKPPVTGYQLKMYLLQQWGIEDLDLFVYQAFDLVYKDPQHFKTFRLYLVELKSGFDVLPDPTARWVNLFELAKDETLGEFQIICFKAFQVLAGFADQDVKVITPKKIFFE